MRSLDFASDGLRHINKTLQALPDTTNEREWQINNPQGQHAIACGLDSPLDVTINGHVGFYCGGMNNKRPSPSMAMLASDWVKT